jgi:hypothetical protein
MPNTYLVNIDDTDQASRGDGELSLEELDVVVGGLARPWPGSQQAAGGETGRAITEPRGHGTSLAAR